MIFRDLYMHYLCLETKEGICDTGFLRNAFFNNQYWSRLVTVSVVISVQLLFSVPFVNYRQFFFHNSYFYKSLQSPFVFLRLTILSSFCFYVIQSNIFLLENSKYSCTSWVIERSKISERGTDQMFRVMTKLQETLEFWQKQTNKQPQNRLKASLTTLL